MTVLIQLRTVVLWYIGIVCGIETMNILGSNINLYWNFCDLKNYDCTITSQIQRLFTFLSFSVEDQSHILKLEFVVWEKTFF